MLNGEDSQQLRHHHMAAYRAAIPVDALKGDGGIAQKIALDSINFW